MSKIKSGDNVKVMRGKDAGSEGEVLKVLKRKNKKRKEVTQVIVKNVNKIKRSQKPNPSLNITGGIIEIEKPIDISNVMLIVKEKKAKKATK